MGWTFKLAGIGGLPSVTVPGEHHLSPSALSSKDVATIKLFAEVSHSLRRPHLAEK